MEIEKVSLVNSLPKIATLPGSARTPLTSPEVAHILPLLSFLGTDGLSANIRLSALNALSDVLTGIVAQQAVQSQDKTTSGSSSPPPNQVGAKKERTRFSPY